MHNTRAAALWRDWQHTGRSLDATNVPCRGLAEYLFGTFAVSLGVSSYPRICVSQALCYARPGAGCGRPRCRSAAQL